MTAQEIIATLGSPVWGEMKLQDKDSALEGILYRLYAMKGMNAKNYTEAIKLATAELGDKLSMRWPSLHLGEVGLALDAGSQGELGDANTALTPSNMIGWIARYVASPIRKEAQGTLSRREVAKSYTTRLLPPEMAEERNERWRAEEPGRAWREFRADPAGYEIICAGYGHALFTALRSWGKMTTIKGETMEQARSRARAYMLRGKQTTFERLVKEQGGEQAYQWRVESELVVMYFRALMSAGRELEIDIKNANK